MTIRIIEVVSARDSTVHEMWKERDTFVQNTSGAIFAANPMEDPVIAVERAERLADILEQNGVATWLRFDELVKENVGPIAWDAKTDELKQLLEAQSAAEKAARTKKEAEREAEAAAQLAALLDSKPTRFVEWMNAVKTKQPSLAGLLLHQSVAEFSCDGVTILSATDYDHERLSEPQTNASLRDSLREFFKESGKDPGLMIVREKHVRVRPDEQTATS